MEESHSRHLLQPLLPPSAAASDHGKPISSNAGITSRLFLVAFIGLVSIWANHEASKGYAITLVNESATTFAGARFQLFYVANEEATRVMIKASNSIENFLYPYSHSSIKKPIESVIVKLADRNLTNNVVVEPGSGQDQFVLNISPSIMGGTNFGHDVDVALRRGVARMWLWDGQGSSPRNLINAIVEYLINILENGSIELLEPTTAECWDPEDGRSVAEFVNHGERRRPGFIRRLNRAMKDGWNDEKLGAALGMSVHKCATSELLRYNFSSV
ncbi:hypothetical protein C2S51_003827 [Perilla frutescens var. frutescens]|nr:hypothetical protein C2S51_003827 [Perilla frutescens var. frutescens]